MPIQEIQSLAQFADETLVLVGKANQSSASEMTPYLQEWSQKLSQAVTGMGASNQVQLIKEQFNLDDQSIAFILLTLLPALDTKYTDFFKEASSNPARKIPTIDLVSSLMCDSYDQKTTFINQLRDDSPIFKWRMLKRLGDDFIQSELLPGKDLVLHLASTNELTRDASGLVSQITKPALGIPADQVKNKPIGQIISIIGGIDARRKSYAFNCSQMLQRPLYQFNAELFQSIKDPVGELTETLLFVMLRNGVLYWEDGISTFQEQADVAKLIRSWLSMKNSLLIVGQDEHKTLPTIFKNINTDSVTLVKADQKINQLIWESVGNEFLQVTNVDYKQLSNTYTTDYTRIEETMRRAAEGKEKTGVAVTTEAVISDYLATSPEKVTDMASRDHSSYSFEDMILPKDTQSGIDHLVKAYQQRAKVNPAHPAGIIAIFEGAKGTGKTMAAICLANQLGIPLYKVDYSALVGVSQDAEKTLNLLFAEAERNTALLLFDNADNLFTESETSDTHRALISTLIQKMESYGCLILLATSDKPKVSKELFQRALMQVDFPVLNSKDQYALFTKILAQKGIKIKNESQLQDMVKKLGANGRQIQNIVQNAIISSDGEHVPLQELEITANDLAKAIDLEKKKQ
ncbi:AAA family ATPase [Reichenbachiella versicolor]|uniref:AAA family ATPase n=1 Tax=Reichenbachiella versicolor TaxID=1821036 RepID=UPI000D6DCD0A|nr:ATP-binding protein [Reichenbachiella versicolor]